MIKPSLNILSNLPSLNTLSTLFDPYFTAYNQNYPLLSLPLPYTLCKSLFEVTLDT